MPQYELVERNTRYTMADYSDIPVSEIRKTIPNRDDYDSDADWSKAIAQAVFPNADDSDSPWQLLGDDGGHYFITEFTIADDREVTINSKCYWKTAADARDWTNDELKGWSGKSTLPTTNTTVTTTTVDFHKPYSS